jgi:Leucine-rich repeat (LRR) protein
LKSDEFDLAYYLKKQSYQPTTVNDLEVLKKNFKNWLFNIRKSAQRWLDYFFPRERRNQITHLDISKNELEGSLNLNDFINLEVFDCFDNKIISLDSSNCEEFSYLNCGKNQLIALLLPKRGRELKFLNLANNKLEENLMIFTHLENLEEL